MYQLGAITDLVEPGEVLNKARELAEAIGNGPEQAIADIKTLLNDAEIAGFEEQLTNERDAMANALGGDEAQIGIGAFLNKQRPVFRKG